MSTNPNHRFDGITPDAAPFDQSEDGPIMGNAPVTVTTEDPIHRMEAARQAVERMGLSWPKTIVPEGSALITSGEEKLKRDRKAWDDAPFAKDALPVVKAALACERRKDVKERVSNLRVRAVDGRIVRAENVNSDPKQLAGLAYTSHAFRQILMQGGVLDGAPSNFGAALEWVSNAERAEIFNRLILKADPKKVTMIRTKLPHEGSARVIRAALSERYGDASDLDVASIIQGMDMPEGAKLLYMPGDHSRFELVFPSQISVPNFKAGDVHKASVLSRNNDIGTGGSVTRGGFTRVLCVNLTLAEVLGQRTSIRHVGQAASVQRKIAQAFQDAVDSLEPLLEVMGYAATVQATVDVMSTMERIASKYGESKSAADAWSAKMKRESYPTTAWGFGAAITDAAHDRGSWETAEEWEQVGSRVTSGAVQAHKAGKSWDTFLREPSPFDRQPAQAARAN